ncbi:MAG: hypothetical protein IPF83_04025 [Rhodanobacteraceae bacterium]|nr:hypothetical protein [Rhodanobacteraceae bacterium]
MRIGEIDDHHPPDQSPPPRSSTSGIIAHPSSAAGNLEYRFLLGHAGVADEGADGVGGATVANATQGRNKWIFTAGDQSVVHQCQQLAFAHHQKIQVQTRELDLAWARR